MAWKEIIAATTNGPNNTGGQHWWVYEPNGTVRPGWPRLVAGHLSWGADDTLDPLARREAVHGILPQGNQAGPEEGTGA